MREKGKEEIKEGRLNGSSQGQRCGLIANSMDPDETAWMRRLIWIHAGHIRPRLFILIMVGVSIAWVPVLKETQGCILALMLAFVTGVIRMILAFVYYSSGGCGKDDNRPGILKNFHYMYFSFDRPTAALVRTTFWTQKSEPYVEEPEPKDSNKDKENGFTNIAATGDNYMQVFSVEEKHVYRDPDLDNTEQDKGLHCAERALNYVCGITAEVDEEKERQLRIHMEKVATLKQNKYAKIGLNIGLVIILSLGTFLYIFWSFWKYEPN